MAKTQAEIQKASDERRGVVSKSYKLHIDDIAYIQELAKQYGLKQNELIMLAVRFYDENVLK